MNQPTGIPTPNHGTWVPPGWPTAAPTPQTWSPPAPPPVKTRRTWPWMVGGIFVLFVVAGIAGAASDNTTTSVSTATGSSPTSQSLADWSGRYGASDASMLAADMTAIQADAGSLDVSGMVASCRIFQRHIATAESHLPTPNASLTATLREAYDHFDRSATYCINGGTTYSPEQLSKSATEVRLGGDALDRATAIVRSLR